MANTDKNIVITPNVGSSSADPQIVFSGANASVGPQNITVRVYPTNNGTLSVEGSAGQLFSITNSFTGTIFSANDVSGVPSLEVLDTGLVKIAQYSGNVLLGTGTDEGAKLHVNGGTAMTAGWNRTVTLRANFPGIVFNSSDTRWASINYDHSSNFIIRVGATSSNTFGTGSNGISINATTGVVNLNQAGATVNDSAIWTAETLTNLNQLTNGPGYLTSAVTSLTGGGGISVSAASGAVTLGSTATSANTASAIVARDSSGDFSAGAVTVTSLVYGTTSISAAGSNQATATAITSDIVQVTAGTGGVRLPAVTGRRVMIRNNTGVTINVYPQTSSQIESLGNNVAYAMLTSTTVELVSFSATQWYFPGAVAT